MDKFDSIASANGQSCEGHSWWNALEQMADVVSELVSKAHDQGIQDGRRSTGTARHPWSVN